MDNASNGLTRRQAAAVLMLGVFVAWAPQAWPNPDPSPVGVWATEGGESHVQIEACGPQICGRIVWLKEPLDKNNLEKADAFNPDPALRSRKVVGLDLLTGFVQDKDDVGLWTGGKIYNPKDGKTYSCKLTMVDANTLRVRGYVGVSLLGKTQIWTRVP